MKKIYYTANILVKVRGANNRMDKKWLFISSEHLNHFEDWNTCLQHVVALGFGGVEVFGNDVIEGSLAHSDQQRNLKILSQQYGMQISFHPWLDWKKKDLQEQKESMLNLLERIVACGSNKINLHLDFLTNRSKGELPIIDLFSSLDSYIKKNNLYIYFENVPINSIESFGTSPQDFMEIFKQLKSNYFFNLDTGHAQISGGIATFINALAPYWHYTHIHDNDGKSDLHHPPGQGLIDWKAFFSLAKSVDYKGIFMYEFHEDGLGVSRDILEKGYQLLKEDCKWKLSK